MSSHFGLSVRFLDPAFHGQRDAGEPEWPPSPLRTFQSLVAAAAARRRGEALDARARAALTWLEHQPPPTVVAPASISASGYRISVPNNAMDVVAAAWCRGNYSNSGDANPATHRTMKAVRPTRMLGGDGVHYLWQLLDPLTDEARGHVQTLADMAGSVVALGWGVDMVVGHGAILSDEAADALPGERWLPSDGVASNVLRVPVPGTLDALASRHARFLKRLDHDGFAPSPSLSVYAPLGYRRATEAPGRPAAAFRLVTLDGSGFRTFDTTRRALSVAGMLRHTTKLAAERAGWSQLKINTFVLGHGESQGNRAHVPVGSRRFAYLPMPSIEARGDREHVVSGVRRVIVSSSAEACEAEVAWARRILSGQVLIDETSREPVALLSLIPQPDTVVRRYIDSATSWATVTPVVLPGHDDRRHYRRRLKLGTTAEEQTRLLERLGDRIDGLLRKAIVQAGFSRVLADHARLEWRAVGFWPGLDLSNRYGVPDHLRPYPRFHVKLRWCDPLGNPLRVSGPVCVGGGRFAGLGLFAALPPDRE